MMDLLLKPVLAAVYLFWLLALTFVGVIYLTLGLVCMALYVLLYPFIYIIGSIFYHGTN